MKKQPNIFLIGPFGAGKSTIGRTLAKKLNLQFYDIDQLIEKLTGVDNSWVFDIEGEEGFYKRESTILDEITQRSGIVLATGGSTVLSEENRLILKSRGIIVYLSVSLRQQYNRIRVNKYNRPLLRGDGVKDKISLFAKVLEPMYKKIAGKEFSTDNKSVKYVVEEIFQYLDKEILI